LAVIFAVCFFLAGCDADTDAEETPLPAPTSTLQFGAPSGSALPSPSGNVVEEAKALLAIVQEAEALEAAHRAVQEHLQAASLLQPVYREQLAAHTMLRSYFQAPLEQGRLRTQEQAILGTYTELLVQNHSPESALLLPALQGLRGHWPQPRIADAAQTVARAAEERYAEAPAIPGSSGSPPVAEEGRDATMMKHRQEALRAADALRALQAELET
jgi:hypothetical protein